MKQGGITLNKELLSSYKSKKEEIRELQYKLQHMNDDNAMMGNPDTILNYKSGYPVPEAVAGVDWKKVFKTEKRYMNKIEILTKECEEIEEFIESIQDSLTRRIFRMYYIEGLSQGNIAKIVHVDRSRVSRKIDDFIKNAHKAQKAQL